MGMSTHVVGFRPPDATWRKMKAIYDACIEADVEVPSEVDRFFDGEDPDPEGVEVKLEGTAAVTEWNNDMREGFEIHVDRLPPGLKIIRFYNAY